MAHARIREIEEKLPGIASNTPLAHEVRYLSSRVAEVERMSTLALEMISGEAIKPNEIKAAPIPAAPMPPPAPKKPRKRPPPKPKSDEPKPKAQRVLNPHSEIAALFGEVEKEQARKKALAASAPPPAKKPKTIDLPPIPFSSQNDTTRLCPNCSNAWYGDLEYCVHCEFCPGCHKAALECECPASGDESF
jgi:hypothetical protein